MSYTRLRYHFVWATKHRARVITPRLEEVIHRAIAKEATSFGGAVIVQNGTEDHLHVVIVVPPTIAISKAAGRMKAVSCGAVRKELKMPEFEWQGGFSCHTLDAQDFGAACRYVRNQKEHHKGACLRPELEKLHDD